MSMDNLNDIDNDEPSDSEIEKILKKYTSPTTCLNNRNSKDEYNKLYSPREQARNNKCLDNYTVGSLEHLTPSFDDVIDLELESDSCGKRKLQDFFAIEAPEEIGGKCKENTLKKKKQWETEVRNDKVQDDYALNTFDIENVRPSYDDFIDLELEDYSDKQKSQEDFEAGKSCEIEGKQKEKTLTKTDKVDKAKTKKIAKNAEKERKKEMAEQQKMLKNALKSVAKSTKPDECMKYIIVEMDRDMTQNEYVMALKQTFQEKEICFRFKSQVLPNIISWSRKIQTIEDMLLKESQVNENHFLLIMRLTEFSEHVKKDNLAVYLGNIFSLLNCKQLTVIVLGTDKPTPPQDIAIIETQMLTKTYFRFVKDVGGLGDLLLEVTKAVAQIPYKLKKEETYKNHNEYFNDSNKDTVKIDKNGNGLNRLWHQMLTMLPLARLETAEAIAAVYSTPDSLFRAYETCEKKEDLLQDINIRRAQGPLISSRRIGPELSRKCFNFFCATENQFL